MILRSGAILVLVCSVAGLSCGPNQRILQSSNENQTAGEATTVNSNSTAATIENTFEQDLNSMRTADFKFILVFRRKDGQPLDAVSKEWVVRNVGPQVNRRKLSDEGKAIIIGSNFPFLPIDPAKVDAAKLVMENHSKPDSGPMFSNSIPNR